MKTQNHSTYSLLLFTLIGTIAIAAPSRMQVINEEVKILPEDGAAGDWFGRVIAINNGVVAVGSRYDTVNGTDSGSAYIFDASTGAQLFKLLPTDGESHNLFGTSIAIDNGVVAVGAWQDNDNGFASGSAYLFNASTGAQIAKLLPSDGVNFDWFGYSIAIDNGIVAIGANRNDDQGSGSGSAYLFDATTGVQLFKLLPNDGDVLDRFGSSIAISNGIVAVGGWLGDDFGTDSGSAYLFDVSTGTQIAKLLPNDGAMEDRFGWAIDIDSGIVAVGSHGDDDNGTDSGSAYLFDAATGVQIAKLLPSDGAAGDFFGTSIGIFNGIVVVGASGDDDNGTDSGSAYYFDASTGAQLVKLLPTDGLMDDRFGASIAIDGVNVAIGAHLSDDNGVDSGSAYVFVVSSSFCLSDLTGDGTVDITDLLELIGAWGPCLACVADINNDNVVDISDLLELIGAWGVCP